jgi:hypothetical protein
MNTPEPRLTSLSHGGGCGCKIAPGVLSEILKGSTGFPIPPQLLVGIETADDAAVYKLNDEQALIATTDFFMPIVDDPFDFGRIAATNAISDVYAMGGNRSWRWPWWACPSRSSRRRPSAASWRAVPASAARPASRSPAVTRSTRSSRSTAWWRSAWYTPAASSATPMRASATCWCWASRSASACCRRRSRRNSCRLKVTRP